MPLDQRKNHFRSSYGGGNVSPNSVSYSTQSSFSVLSSSASVERCSSASDVLDHDSDMSPNMSGGFGGSSSSRGLDPDPNKNSTVHKNSGPHLLRKNVENAEALKEYIEEETEGENQMIYSARSSFSHTIKECQNRKSRSELLQRRFDRRRPASLDLNNQSMNITSTSPRLGMTTKNFISSQRNNMFPSPGTPNYHPTNYGVQKGWSSERVPLHKNPNRIHGSLTLRPYNSRKTLPSKWEDAERWIISPVVEDGFLKPSSFQHSKSKSGPLGPTVYASYSMYSSAMPSFEGDNVVTESPSSTGVLNADNNSLSHSRYKNVCEGIERSVSLHNCSESLNQSVIQITPDDEIGGLKDSGTIVSCDVLRRDMATQMSPETSPYSSPNSCFSSSTTLVEDLQHHHSSNVRDVQVDDQVILTRWSKKNRDRIRRNGSEISDSKNGVLEVQSADQEALEMRKSITKVKREEAKITAWENLQNAKAEAAIRKLEMKLEKKRSSSMNRIMHKLQSSQKKAHEMRETVLSDESREVGRSSRKVISLFKTCQIRSLGSCFTCPAF